MLTQITRWPFQQLRPIRRWLRNCYRKPLKFCLFIYFVLVACYKLFEIRLVNVDLFDSVANASPCSSPQLPGQQLISEALAIDAVYTWVNGSDERMLAQLQQVSHRLTAQKLGHFCLTPDAKLPSPCNLLPLVLIRPLLPNPHHYFDDVLKFETFNASATLIYLHHLDAARSLGANCVRIIEGDRLYKLTNLYSCGDSDPALADNVPLSINSLFRFTTDDGKCDFAWSGDPMKSLLPTTRKQLQPLQLESNRSFLYTSKFTPSNLSKVVSLAQAKENASSECNFSLSYPLPALMTDENFFHHQLENENMRRNRFADNDELKYSLRSLDRFAPWIRQVFLVTNGQIPSWLNVEHPKLRIVQHRDIFPNQSHLPTFSSSAIECHLHRIPNLSKPFFLYLNDDIILGDHIYPDDFYTNSKGFKVYLSWPVPNCAEGCPLNWLNDGYCDKACNSSKCLWDGGDCLRSANATSSPISVPQSRVDSSGGSPSVSSSDLCAPNCLSNWLGDSFCDQVCNQPECAYDMADCGVNQFDAFEEIVVNQTSNFYIYQTNSSVIYLNFTEFLQPINEQYHVKLSGAQYQNVPCVFSAVLNLKHSILTILFQRNSPKTAFTLQMVAQINQVDFNFSIQVDVEGSDAVNNKNVSQQFNLTRIVQSIEAEQTMARSANANRTSRPFEAAKTMPTIDRQSSYIIPCDVNFNSLPEEIRGKFEQIDSQHNLGLVTKEGKEYFYSQLKQLYANIICANVIHHADVSTYQAVDGPILPNFLSGNQSDQSYRSRRLLDAYADSLIYVNHLYNKVFGVQSRQVVAHMPHFIDADIIARLQTRFADFFERTSASQLRNSEDMQFSFSYFHFLMSETEDCNVEAIVERFDTDQSRTLSLNELKTFAIHLTGLPLTAENSKKFYDDLRNCCSVDCQHLPAPGNDSELPIWQQEWPIDLAIDRLLNCTQIREKIVAKWPKKNRNKYEILKDDEVVAFKMLRSNETVLEMELDELRGKRPKFMCLNDNLEHGANATADANLRRILQQFFTSLFPLPSPFERPPGQLNRFLYIDQYNQWKRELAQQSDTFFSGSYLFIIIHLVLFLKMLLQ